MFGDCGCAGSESGVGTAAGVCVGVNPNQHRANMCAFACSPQNYIQELRGCASKEQEKERVDKELGKIRKKYTSDKAMSGACQGGFHGEPRWGCGILDRSLHHLPSLSPSRSLR